MIEEIKTRSLGVIPKLNIKYETACEYMDIFFSCFDNKFFSEASYNTNPITKKIQYKHPLVNSLLITDPKNSELGIVELLEIGLYLREFYKDKNIKFCLSCLKNASFFESTLLQLAFAFRLKKSGSDVNLEPITERGKSDILFKFDEKTYIAECYRINKTFLDYIGRLQFDLADFLFSKVSKSKKFCFTIEINTIITPHGIRRLTRQMEQALTTFFTNNLLKMEIKIDKHIFGIQDITGIEPDPHFDFSNGQKFPEFVGKPAHNGCVCQVQYNARTVFEVSKMKAKEGVRGNRLFVWENFKRDLHKNAFNILKDKLNSKLKQTKINDPTVGRILIAEFPFGLFFEGRLESRHEEILKQAERNFENISCIILCERRANEINRFGYRAMFLPSGNKVSFPERLYQNLLQLEMGDIFKAR